MGRPEPHPHPPRGVGPATSRACRSAAPACWSATAACARRSAVIVRPADGVRHLITQPDHAALAGRIMEHWASLATAERRDADPARHRATTTTAGASPTRRRPSTPPTGADPRLRRRPGRGASKRSGRGPGRPGRRAVGRGAGRPPRRRRSTTASAATPAWDAFFAGDGPRRATRLLAADRRRDGGAGPRLRLRAARRSGVAGVLQRLDATRRCSGRGRSGCSTRGTCSSSPTRSCYDVPFEVEARVLPRAPFASDEALQAAWRAAPIVDA